MKIIKCKHCDFKAVKVKTPSGTTLYYCSQKSCNFSGKILNLSIKTKNKEYGKVPSNEQIMEIRKIITRCKVQIEQGIDAFFQENKEKFNRIKL